MLNGICSAHYRSRLSKFSHPFTVTPHKHKFREGNVVTHVCHSVHRGVSVKGGVCQWRLCPGGSLSRGVSVRETFLLPHTVMFRRYASYWIAFLLLVCLPRIFGFLLTILQFSTPHREKEKAADATCDKIISNIQNMLKCLIRIFSKTKIARAYPYFRWISMFLICFSFFVRDEPINKFATWSRSHTQLFSELVRQFMFHEMVQNNTNL